MVTTPQPEMVLGRTTVRVGSLPYVIAEIGVNHEGSLSLAKELIDMAAAGGANAAKFQTYKAAKLAVKESPAYWDTTKEPTRSQYEVFRKFDSFEPEDYVELKRYCDKRGIDFVSTPFDSDAVDLLDLLIPFFKIASADITNTPLLRQVAGRRKPVILSTGAATLWEIENAVGELTRRGAPAIGLLHCMLNYPTNYENAGLSMISTLRRLFPHNVIGYSDHTLPEPHMVTLTTAVILGAAVIEKHFTHDKNLTGNDHYHAMDMADLKVFLENCRRVLEVSGSVDHASRENELAARRNARRSIVAATPIRKGERITEAHLTCKRPATGISPLHWDDVVGRRASHDLDPDQILEWHDLDTELNRR